LITKQINLDHFFPTPIWSCKLDHFNHNSIKKWILNKSKKVKGRSLSNYKGWQSDLIFNNKTFNPLIKEIYNVVLSLNLKIKKLSMPQLWCSVNNKNNFNMIHNHGQFDLSGCYYIETPKDCGSIAFRDPRPGALINYNFYRVFSGAEMKSIDIEPKTLIVFPSFLDHLVWPNESNFPRISINFDIKVDEYTEKL